MRKVLFVTLFVVAAAGSASAQASIDPGMSKDQVIAKLGKPTSEHSSGTTTYLYYKNGQESKVGMSDMVALDNGKVVDAIFRSTDRKYSGKSSSPAPVSRDAAIAKGNGGKMPAKTAPAAHTPAPVKAPAKAPETKKAPATAKAPDTKKAAPATPPTKRNPEPLKSADPKKIAPPAKTTKTADTSKKASPAPAKKP